MGKRRDSICNALFLAISSRYKVGHVICVSHGMGMPSLSILLHEMYKLCAYAGCLSKCTFIRSGTCGGVGVEPGTVAISTGGVDPSLNPYYTQSILGKVLSSQLIRLRIITSLRSQRSPSWRSSDPLQNRPESLICAV